MQDLNKHLFDFFKGMIAAMATSAVIAAFQYIGAHIGELTSFLMTAAAATTTIKYTR